MSQDSIASRQRSVTPGGSQKELVQPAGAGGGDDGETVGLKKRVGLVSGIALIVGTMIGKFTICIYFFILRTLVFLRGWFMLVSMKI